MKNPVLISDEEKDSDGNNNVEKKLNERIIQLGKELEYQRMLAINA